MPTIERTAHMMGTRIMVRVTAKQPEALGQLALAQLEAYEQQFSANDPQATLMQLNAKAGQAGMVMPQPVFDLIKLGKHYSRYPNGNLNIAIGPLVKAWHIGFDDARVPSAKEIQAALALSDPEAIQLEDQTRLVTLTKPGMEIDLGALAKGYIADLVAQSLQGHGATSGILNLGGNVLTFGPSPHEDGLWRVGIQDPKAPLGTYKRVVACPAGSVVTSGVYQRRLVTASGTYHHILDRHTGQPLTTAVASLTIFSTQSVLGEVWTTMLFGQPVGTILDTVAQLPAIDAMVIMQDGTVYDTRKDGERI